jgi:hypothetical protein
MNAFHDELATVLAHVRIVSLHLIFSYIYIKTIIIVLRCYYGSVLIIYVLCAIMLNVHEYLWKIFCLKNIFVETYQQNNCRIKIDVSDNLKEKLCHSRQNLYFMDLEVCSLHDSSFIATYSWLLKAPSATYGWSLKIFSDL